MPIYCVPSFSVLVAIVNAGQIRLSGDEIGGLNAPLADELANDAVNVQVVKLGLYHYEEVWMRVEHVVSSTFSLPDVHSSDVKTLVESMHALRLN